MTGSIRVVSKRHGGRRADSDETIIDGDRNNPVLGNPYHLRDWTDRTERVRVIGLHRADFEKDLATGGPMSKAVEQIALRVKAGEQIALACWCAPLPCHLDHVAEAIQALAKSGQETPPKHQI